MTVAPIRARLTPSMKPTLGAVRPMTFVAADAAWDLPGHVRAGSAVRRWGERFVVVQDDVHALALVDPRTGQCTAVPLPRGADGRRTFGESTGNKGFKMDLEACVVLGDGRLVVLGSGSKGPRERVVVVTPELEVRVIEAGELYGMLRREVGFAGSELNLEGAAVVGGAVRFFQRGNGAPRGELQPVDATGELELGAFARWLDGGPLPPLERVRPVDLGETAGVRFGFTDATVLPDGRVAFVAGAEDSPDTYRDGAILGGRFGVMDGEAVWVADILDVDGTPSRVKLEGIDWIEETPEGWSFMVVADMDTPEVPALMGTLTVCAAGVPSAAAT